jgi:hypothetical protein
MTIDETTNVPIVRFFQLVSGGHTPQRADRAVGGIIPARALRYCEAITTAAGYGWYVFLPLKFKVVWDGHDILWTYNDIDEWLPLHSAAQYPGFRDDFDRVAPTHVRGFSPTFLARSIQPGGLQIWTGCIAKTAPGWSLLVRSVANLPKSLSYEMFEGIIETDHWFGPLFTNVRLLKTDIPIEFRDDIPFIQLQPVRRQNYRDQFLNNFATGTMANLGDAEWSAFHRTVVMPNSVADRRPGQYAVSVRRAAAASTRSDAA